MVSVFRSIFAVMLGYMAMMLSVIVLTLLFIKTMGLKSAHPTPGYLFVNVVYTFLAAGIGGYVTARIAEVKPMIAAGVLATLMLIMGVLSYRHYTGVQPAWYQVMMQIVPSLCALGGAALYARNAPANPR